MTPIIIDTTEYINKISYIGIIKTGLKILGFLKRAVPVQVRPRAPNVEIIGENSIIDHHLGLVQKSVKESIVIAPDTTMTPQRKVVIRG